MNNNKTAKYVIGGFFFGGVTRDNKKTFGKFIGEICLILENQEVVFDNSLC